MKSIMLPTNLLLITAVFIGNYFYLTEGGLLLKGLCSSGFALIGIVNLLFCLLQSEKQLAYPALLTIGLILAMLGDIFISSSSSGFLLGAGLFALGHVLYTASYCVLRPFHPLDGILSVVIFLGAAAFLLFSPSLSFPDTTMKIICLVYALIISCMVGKALSHAFLQPTCLHIVLAVGSVLFFFSDLMLVFDWFMDMGRIAGLLCMSTYYPAQCLLALSGCLWYFTRK